MVRRSGKVDKARRDGETGGRRWKIDACLLRPRPRSTSGAGAAQGRISSEGSWGWFGEGRWTADNKKSPVNFTSSQRCWLPSHRGCVCVDHSAETGRSCPEVSEATGNWGGCTRATLSLLLLIALCRTPHHSLQHTPIPFSLPHPIRRRGWGACPGTGCPHQQHCNSLAKKKERCPASNISSPQTRSTDALPNAASAATSAANLMAVFAQRLLMKMTSPTRR